MILFWRIEKDSLSLLPKNSMKKISLLLFFLFLVGCQSYPQELSTSPTSLVEIRNIPYALKNIDYNCIWEEPPEEVKVATGREKQFVFKDFKLKVSNPIEWICRDSLTKYFFQKADVPYYYASGNRVYPYNLWYMDEIDESVIEPFRQKYLSGADLSEYMKKDGESEYIEYVPYDKPITLSGFISENHLKVSGISTWANLATGTGIFSIYVDQDVIQPAYVIKEWKPYYYRFQGVVGGGGGGRLSGFWEIECFFEEK